MVIWPSSAPEWPSRYANLDFQLEDLQEQFLTTICYGASFENRNAVKTALFASFELVYSISLFLNPISTNRHVIGMNMIHTINEFCAKALDCL